MHVDDKELFAALVLAIISRRDPMRKFKGIYFYINNSRVEKTRDYGNDLDNERYDLGNYFLFSELLGKSEKWRDWRRKCIDVNIVEKKYKDIILDMLT